MRVTKTENPKINNRLSIIQQTMQLIKEGDCFGKEWSITDPSCTRCSVFLLCAAQFDRLGLEAKKAKHRTDFGKQYIDENKFATIPKDSIADSIKMLIATDKLITFDNLVSVVDQAANVADKMLVNIWCNSFMIEYGFIKTEDGRLQNKI